MIIDERTFYKILKEEKLFGKYCLFVSEVVSTMDKPRDKYSTYFKELYKLIKTKSDISKLLNNLKRWIIHEKKIKIL